MFDHQPKSKEGAARQVNAILNSYFRDFAGGGAYGWDWPTLRLNSPERYAKIIALCKAIKDLPSRRKP